MSKNWSEPGGPVAALTVPLASVRADGGTQMRAALSEDTVEEYRAVYDAAGGPDAPPDAMPALDCVCDGEGNHWLYDGFHRFHGAGRAGVQLIAVRARPGTLADARWLACAANPAHGRPRSNADKRRAVEAAIAMRPTMSNSAIAEHCSVSHTLVNEVRKQVSLEDSSSQSSRTGKDGRTISTGNIGSGRKKAAGTRPAAEAAEPEPDAEAAPDEDPEVEQSNSGGEPAEPEPAAPAEGPLLDALGQSVPPAFAPHFEAGGRIRALYNSIRSCERELDDLCQTGHAAALKRQCRLVGDKGRAQLEYLHMAAWAVRNSLPHTLCPRCFDACPGVASKGCNLCDGTGVVCKSAFEQCEEQYRFPVENRDRVAAELAEGEA